MKKKRPKPNKWDCGMCPDWDNKDGCLRGYDEYCGEMNGNNGVKNERI